MKKIGVLEIFLIEVILYFLLWLSDTFLATFISTVFGCICFFLLLIAWVAEKIEPSRVPPWYFRLMIVSVISPALVAGLFYLLGKV